MIFDADPSSMNWWERFWYNIGQFFLQKDSAGLNYLTRILFAVAIVVVAWFVIKGITLLMKRAFGIKRHGPDIDKSAKLFIVTLIKVFLWIGVAFIVVSVLKIDLAGFAGVASAIAVALGLAVQDLVGCMFSGMLLLSQKVVLTGEYIEVHNAYGVCEGTVDKVHIFFTYLITVQGQQIVIPNNNMTKATITNFSRVGKRRVDYDFGVHYNTDVAKAKKVLTDMILQDKRLLKDEPYSVYLFELGAYSIMLRIRCWTSYDDYWPFFNDLTEKVLLTCRKNQIEIPSSTDLKIEKK